VFCNCQLESLADLLYRETKQVEEERQALQRKVGGSYRTLNVLSFTVSPPFPTIPFLATIALLSRSELTSRTLWEAGTVPLTRPSYRCAVLMALGAECRVFRRWMGLLSSARSRISLSILYCALSMYLVVKVYKRCQSTGAPRGKLLELLVSFLPHVNKQSIEAHEDWYRAWTLLNRRKKLIKDNHDKEVEKVMEEGKAELVQHLQEAEEAREREEEGAQWDRRCRETEERLQALRRAKEAEEGARLQEERQRRALEVERSETMALAEQQRQEEQRRRVAEFKRIRELAQEERRREEDRRARVEAESRKRQVDATKADVRRRAEMREMRRREREERAVSPWIDRTRHICCILFLSMSNV